MQWSKSHSEDSTVNYHLFFQSNDCLTHFNVSWNGLSLLGCVALGRFLKKNEALIELDISNNRIGLLGTQKLAAGISSHPNLKVLKVCSMMDHRQPKLY